MVRPIIPGEWCDIVLQIKRGVMSQEGSSGLIAFILNNISVP